MARTLYLCGHGGWKMKDGFVTVPQRCDFTFYSHAHKTIYQGAAEKIVAGEYNGWSDDFSAGHSVQNMTLYADDPKNIKPTEIAARNNTDPNARVFFLNYFGLKEITLENFFECYNINACAPVHFIWTCCRYTEVKKSQAVGGAKYGMNASEDLINREYDFRDFDRKLIETIEIPRAA
jgi:hypothetical protein